MAAITRRACLEGAGAGLAACALVPLFPRSASAAARTLGQMVVVPAGSFLMGTTPREARAFADAFCYHVSWFEGELPQRTVDLPAFAIGRFPVTNLEYAAFCAATGHRTPAHWPQGQPPQALHRHPVTHLNKHDAEAYAAWLGLRLPTEAEWEKAARGADGRIFPWGDTFDPSACQWNSAPLGPGPGTAPVDAHPSGASPWGVEDMVGNVAEWCADGPSPVAAWIKGGAWISTQVVNLRPAARNMSGYQVNGTTFYGFRCARSLT
jgi:formylglycine-generating enzyme required for sulfatase activity